MPQSIVTLPLRISLRSTRAILRRTREAADLGLAALELVGQVLGEPDIERSEPRARAWSDDRVRGGPVDGAGPGSGPVDVRAADRNGAREAAVDAAAEIVAEEAEIVAPEDPEPAVDEEPSHVSAEPELVEEVAEPGAEDGAGAQVRIEPPFDGYDALRAADVVSRLRGVDDAELAETELYERAHRSRRTVLDAIAREARRRGPR